MEITIKITEYDERTVKLTNIPIINEISPYVRWFDNSCAGWTKDGWFNKAFISHQERYLNDVLSVKRHLYLNEVYDCLGMARTRAGQLVGWIYDKDKPVKIDILEIKDDCSLLLKFNVDGIIIDKV